MHYVEVMAEPRDRAYGAPSQHSVRQAGRDTPDPDLLETGGMPAVRKPRGESSNQRSDARRPRGVGGEQEDPHVGADRRPGVQTIGLRRAGRNGFLATRDTAPGAMRPLPSGARRRGCGAG